MMSKMRIMMKMEANLINNLMKRMVKEELLLRFETYKELFDEDLIRYDVIECYGRLTYGYDNDETILFQLTDSTSEDYMFDIEPVKVTKEDMLREFAPKEEKVSITVEFKYED